MQRRFGDDVFQNLCFCRSGMPHYTSRLVKRKKGLSVEMLKAAMAATMLTVLGFGGRTRGHSPSGQVSFCVSSKTYSRGAAPTNTATRLGLSARRRQQPPLDARITCRSQSMCISSALVPSRRLWPPVRGAAPRTKAWFSLASSSSSNNNSVDDGMLVAQSEMTVLTALRDSIEYVSAIDEPVASATQILAHCLSLPWDTGYRDLLRLYHESLSSSLTNFHKSSSCASLARQRLTVDQAGMLNDLLQRRLAHEPIQYLIGQWDFLEYTIKIKPPLLCPRPETEELVQLVLQDIVPDGSCRILDVGCGTGCIGIALASANLKSKGKLRSVHVTALDVEVIAVETSRENAAAILGPSWADCYTVHLCAAEDYSRGMVDRDKRLYDIVVSNPPYIPAADMETLSPGVQNYESRDALYGGSSDGMHVIRTIVQQLPAWCRVGAICWMEVDPSHPRLLKQWLGSQDLGVEFVASRQDMFGRDRFVMLRTTSRPAD
jgi:release factor glutamine methyltransferase